MRPAAPGWFSNMDPPAHTRYRKLLIGAFTLRRMRALEAWISEVADARLDAMDTAGPPAELVRDFALPIPSLVICELLGVPYEDHDRFQDMTERLVRIDAPDAAMDAMRQLIDYMHDLVRLARGNPGDHLLGELARHEAGLTDEELTNIGMGLLTAGHETTANMIALGTFALLRHPDQFAALRAHPTTIDNAVEELLRHLSILHYGVPSRSALEDVELAGELIRAGETVVVSLPAANRDPARFSDPDTLWLDRADSRGHLAFGHGPHQCLGQQLARVEMRIAIQALTRRLPRLRLAISPREVPMRAKAIAYGVDRLPVTWG